MFTARSLVLAFLLLSAAAGSSEAASLSAGAAATLKRDSARCSAHADVNACYDAIRWNPGDPALLIALGDALVRARRPADAIRNYRRAAEVAPSMRGIVAAKISTAQAKLAPKRAPGNPPVARASINADSVNAAAGKHFSNADPEAQSP
jgi:cytochrome c-type biogenesis protein CcmH/NrfG